MRKITLSLIMIFALVATIYAQTDAKTTTPNVNETQVNGDNSDAITYLINESLDIVVDADTTALKARLFKFYYRSQPLGLTRWFPGNTTVFTAKEGTGYIGANFNNTANVGTIDTWLVTPKKVILAGDSIRFWQRSPDGSTWPDYLMIMYNPAGDSLPTAASWTTMVAAYQTSTAGWVESKFRIPTASTGPQGGRLAIRYYVTGGGPNGANSDYIGIDHLRVLRNDGVGIHSFNKSDINVNLYPNPVNDMLNLTLNNIAASQAQIIIYNAIGSMVYNQYIQVQNNVPVNIDMSNFTSGGYMLQLISNNELVTKKFSVVK
jgi:hypothetical protein